MNSPFIDHISDCKKRMRKLRKKIYKHNINQNDKKTLSKNQDLSSILIGIFQKRQLPPTIISSLKNKRNIDIFSLKSLVIGNQQELKWDRTTLRSKTSSQEQQVQQMYKEHCQRMQDLKKIQTPKFNARIFTCNYMSSTEGDCSSHSDEPSHDYYACSEFDNKDYSEHPVHHYDISAEENIFSEVVLEQKNNTCQINLNAFDNFQMGQSSILSTQNIFNF